MQGPHRSIDIVGSGAPKMSQNSRGRGLQGEHDRVSAMADRPTSDAAGQLQSVELAGGWAHKMVGTGRVSGTVAHVSEQAGNTTGGRDRRSDAGYGKSTGPPLDVAGRSIGRHLSGLSCRETKDSGVSKW